MSTTYHATQGSPSPHHHHHHSPIPPSQSWAGNSNRDNPDNPDTKNTPDNEGDSFGARDRRKKEVGEAEKGSENHQVKVKAILDFGTDEIDNSPDNPDSPDSPDSPDNPNNPFAESSPPSNDNPINPINPNNPNILHTTEDITSLPPAQHSNIPVSDPSPILPIKMVGSEKDSNKSISSSLNPFDDASDDEGSENDLNDKIELNQEGSGREREREREKVMAGSSGSSTSSISSIALEETRPSPQPVSMLSNKAAAGGTIADTEPCSDQLIPQRRVDPRDTTPQDPAIKSSQSLSPSTTASEAAPHSSNNLDNNNPNESEKKEKKIIKKVILKREPHPARQGLFVITLGPPGFKMDQLQAALNTAAEGGEGARDSPIRQIIVDGRGQRVKGPDGKFLTLEDEGCVIS